MQTVYANKHYSFEIDLIKKFVNVLYYLKINTHTHTHTNAVKLHLYDAVLSAC